MKITIVVTHYNEPWEICEPLFQSLAIQRGYPTEEVELILLNDGDEVVFDQPTIQKYLPFHARVGISHEHIGISKLRNKGIQLAGGEYIMFCDCDDRFCNAYGLRMLFAKMNEGYDFISSAFIEEHNFDGKFEIVSREKDCTFIHGKAFKVSYLKANDIKFTPELTINEDGYFVCLASSLTDSKAEIQTPFYSWVWRDNSVACKSDPLWTLKTYDKLMKMRDLLCAEMRRRGKNELFQDFVVKTLCDSYYDTFSSRWVDPANADLVNKAEKAMKVFYVSYRDVYRKTPVKRIAEIMTMSRFGAWSKGEFVETRTIKEFLTHLLSDVR